MSILTYFGVGLITATAMILMTTTQTAQQEVTNDRT
mgnify:CR=1 FL=1|jgi:hypothetical protein